MDAAGNSLGQVLLQGFQKDLQVTENPTWTLLHKLSMYIATTHCCQWWSSWRPA
jgi:hypothetical protein